MSESMGRRDFLKTAALSSMALGAAGMLAGCSPQGGAEQQTASAADMTWDKEVDLVVIGSGTGSFAALAAAKLSDASVCLLEKGNFWGGTAATSGGGMAIPLTDVAKAAGAVDSKEEVIKYFNSASEGRANEAVVNSFADNGNDFLNWLLETTGWQCNPSTLFGDYYEALPGWIPFGRASLGFAQNGEAIQAKQMWEQLNAALVEAGVDIMMETPATELVVDGEGAVVGVKAEQKGKAVAIKAKNVIVATGGFDHDDEMRAKHMPFKILATNASMFNTGDGHKMGMAIGADVSYMDSCWGAPAILTTGQDPRDLIANNEIAQEIVGTDWAMYRGLPGAVVVNRKGHRIGNEATAYDSFFRAFSYYDNGEMEHLNIPSYFICDAACWNTYSLPGHTVGSMDGGYFDETYGSKGSVDEVPAWFVQADTLEELAGKMGIDPEGLAVELAAFNENAEKGIDPVYHRGEKQLDLNTTAVMAGSRTDIANPCLAPVATPPFYAAVYVPGTCGTGGGLTINENAQVMTPMGEPISGLYAVGNCSSGVSGGRYVHGGISLGSGSVMGWVAVHHALGIK